MKNQTQNTLNTLEHDVVSIIGEAMVSILDNGDIPHNRIDAIVGLHNAMGYIIKKLDKVSLTISEAK